ncbi:MAG: hypothetical protein Q9210_003854 [Variospora velana]
MRVWNCKVNIPYVPLSFTRAIWTGNRAPKATGQTQAAFKRIARRAPSLVICDIYPTSCQRIPHGRFVVPSTFLDGHIPRGSRQLLKKDKGIIDEYYVEHEHLIEVLTAPLREDGEIAIDRRGRTFKAADFLCDTLSTLQAGVNAVKENHKHTSWNLGRKHQRRDDTETD